MAKSKLPWDPLEALADLVTGDIFDGPAKAVKELTNGNGSGTRVEGSESGSDATTTTEPPKRTNPVKPGHTKAKGKETVSQGRDGEHNSAATGGEGGDGE